MNIKLQIDGDTEEFHISDGSSVLDLLSELNLFPDAYIIMRGKNPIPLDCILNDGDAVKLIKVASGG